MLEYWIAVDTMVCSGKLIWLFLQCLKLTLKVGSICPLKFIDPTNLGLKLGVTLQIEWSFLASVHLQPFPNKASLSMVIKLACLSVCNLQTVGLVCCNMPSALIPNCGFPPKISRPLLWEHMLNLLHGCQF